MLTHAIVIVLNLPFVLFAQMRHLKWIKCMDGDEDSMIVFSFAKMQRTRLWYNHLKNQINNNKISVLQSAFFWEFMYHNHFICLLTYYYIDIF